MNGDRVQCWSRVYPEYTQRVAMMRAVFKVWMGMPSSTMHLALVPKD